MSHTIDCDVLVVGGGLVGAAFALSLQASGLRIVLIEASPPPTVPADGWDNRIYAISPGNIRFLERLGAWNDMDARRLAPIHAMAVWGDDGQSRLDFNAYEANVAALGCIVESRLLQSALWARLAASPDIEVISDVRCESVAWREDTVALTLKDGRAVAGRLLVGADGGQSWVRSQAGLTVATSDYRQSGVVANFATEIPHQNVARQWFRDDGILAWLPLPGNRVSMVWSTDHGHAQRLLGMTPEALSQTVGDAGHRQLGEMTLITPAAAFPLRMQNAESLVKPGLALIGDAAHLVHPLAGQGVNLGFHDAICLAEVLRGRAPQADIGDYILLRRYERTRKLDILAMQRVTGGLRALFQSRLPGMDRLRNRGMALTNRSPLIKKRLIAHAMR